MTSVTWARGQSTRLNRVRLSNTVTSATGWRGIRARPEANVHALVTCGWTRRPGTPGSPWTVHWNPNDDQSDIDITSQVSYIYFFLLIFLLCVWRNSVNDYWSLRDLGKNRHSIPLASRKKKPTIRIGAGERGQYYRGLLYTLLGVTLLVSLQCWELLYTAVVYVTFTLLWVTFHLHCFGLR